MRQVEEFRLRGRFKEEMPPRLRAVSRWRSRYLACFSALVKAMDAVPGALHSVTGNLTQLPVFKSRVVLHQWGNPLFACLLFSHYFADWVHVYFGVTTCGGIARLR